MIIFWIFLGALMASALWYMYINVHTTRKMSATTWILTISSVLWGGFTLAWVGSSIAEGEIQAAGMGLLIFGIMLIALVVITRVMILGKKNASRINANTSA